MISYKLVYVWLFSLNIIFVRTTYTAACINNSFSLIAGNILSCEYNRIYFTYLTTDEYLGSFQF